MSYFVFSESVVDLTTTAMNEETKNPEKERTPFSQFEVWSTVISIVGFVSVLIGLYLNERAVRTDTYLKTYGWTLEIDKVLVENAALRPYFTDNKPLNSATDSSKVEAIADYMLDIFDAVLNNKSYFETHAAAEEQWKKAVGDYFKKSPVLCQRFQSNLGMYSSALEEVYKSK